MALVADIGGDGALFVGEDKVFNLELIDGSGNPVDMSGLLPIIFDVRKTDKAADPAIFSKTATLVGVFNIVRLANTQRATVTLTDDEMNTVRARTYRHSWKSMVNGAETVLAYGNFAPQKATAP